MLRDGRSGARSRERLQTPVFLMTDLDIGMNQRLCKPLEWDDARRYDRGKVMTAEMLDAARSSEGISMWTATAFRSAPIGTHPSKGGYFTAHLEKRLPIYSEQGPDYKQHAATLEEVRDGEDARSKPVLNASKDRRASARSTTARPVRRWRRRSTRSPQGLRERLRLRSFPFQTRSSTSSPRTPRCS